MKPSPLRSAVTPDEQRLIRVKRLARLLDAAVGVPGTRIRFGLDALIGLVPGLGDAIATAMSGYILVEAARAGASKRLLLRMLYNIGIDTVAGAVPLLGDLMDVFWKSNDRNVRLLEHHIHDPDGTRAATGWFFLSILAMLVAIVVGVVIGLGWVLRRIIP